MAVIKVENYRNIATFYAQAQAQVAGVADYYYDAAYEIVLLQVFDPEIDLLSSFHNAYLSAQAIYDQAPQSVTAAVSALQAHVLNRARTGEATPARFTDINDWIDAAGTNGVGLNVGRQDDVDSSFRVESEFAALSANSGYTIDADNIV